MFSEHTDFKKEKNAIFFFQLFGCGFNKILADNLPPDGFISPWRQMGSGEEEDGGDDVEEVEDGGGEHQPVEVPLHDRAGGEVEQAAQVSKEAKEADDHLSGNK